MNVTMKPRHPKRLDRGILTTHSFRMLCSLLYLFAATTPAGGSGG